MTSRPSDRPTTPVPALADPIAQRLNAIAREVRTIAAENAPGDIAADRMAREVATHLQRFGRALRREGAEHIAAVILNPPLCRTDLPDPTEPRR